MNDKDKTCLTREGVVSKAAISTGACTGGVIGAAAGAACGLNPIAVGTVGFFCAGPATAGALVAVEPLAKKLLSCFFPPREPDDFGINLLPFGYERENELDYEPF